MIIWSLIIPALQILTIQTQKANRKGLVFAVLGVLATLVLKLSHMACAFILVHIYHLTSLAS